MESLGSIFPEINTVSFFEVACQRIDHKKELPQKAL